MSSYFLVSLLLATASADYMFNGFRGLIPPTTTTTTNDNNNNNYNNVQGNSFTNLNNRNDVDSEESTLTTTNKYNGKDRRCVQRMLRDFRPVPGSCSQFTMCSGGVIIKFDCPAETVFNDEVKSCVPKGSKFDTCEDSRSLLNTPSAGVWPHRPATQILCPRGVTYKKANPTHCARYYDCGKPAMMERWENHEWECKYPFLFNEDTKKCEHYSMVSCGTRKIAYDQCDYKAYGCNGHAHCRPCEVTYPSCKNLPDGMNQWQGRTPSPYYVVCAGRRVVYSGSCPSGQLFDGKIGTCAISPMF